MTLQTELQQAVTRVQADSQILHTVIHGNDQTDVTTENGVVKTLSKLLKEMAQTFQEHLKELGMEGETLQESVTAVEILCEAAEKHAQRAETFASSLNLPKNLKGHGGQLLAVNPQETGYEAIQSKAVFYGLRKEGAKLIAESGDRTYKADQFPVWFITLPGVSFSLNADGHLLIKL